MKTIPLSAAFGLLERALVIDVNDSAQGWLKSEFTLHTADDGEDEFLYLEATNDEGLMWTFKFLRSENATVIVNGDIMTLVSPTVVHDDVKPKADIRLLVPLQLEGCAEAKAALLHVLTNHHEGAGEFENIVIDGLKSLGVKFDKEGNVISTEASPEEEIPFEVRKALDHVRTFHPEVDRVVFWADGRWAYMTDGHEVPKFDKRVDTGVLEDAGNAVSNLSPCRPIAFQLPDDAS